MADTPPLKIAQFVDQVASRVLAAASAQAAGKGGKLTKRDRDAIRLGAAMGSAATLDIIREQQLTALLCPACGLVDDHMGGCPESGTAPQPGALG